MRSASLVSDCTSSLTPRNTNQDDNPNTHDNNGNLKKQQIKAPGMDVTQTYTCITLTANDVPLSIQTSYRYNLLDDLIGWLL